MGFFVTYEKNYLLESSIQSSIKNNLSSDTKKLLFKPNRLDGEYWTPERIQAIQAIVIISLKIATGYLAAFFVDIKLAKIATAMMIKSKKNTKLYDFLTNEINKFYFDHPSYTPISLKELQKEGFFKYTMAKYYKRSFKDILKQLKPHPISAAIISIINRFIPKMPLNFLLAIPVKMALTYLGFDIGEGSFYNLIIDVNGNATVVGISYTKDGFKLDNIQMFYRTGERISVNNLPDPPKDSYTLSNRDIDNIIDKYGKEESKEIKKITNAKFKNDLKKMLV